MAGYLVSQDLSNMLQQLRLRLPHLGIDLAPHLGAMEGMLGLMLRQIEELSLVQGLFLHKTAALIPVIALHLVLAVNAQRRAHL